MLIKKTEKMICTSLRRANIHRLRLYILCLVFAISAALPSAALAATYYVDAQGTSGGSGTSDDPYHRQGNEILNLGQPGDVVCLQDGYYGEIDTSARSNSDYITIQAQPGHNPEFRRIVLNSGSKWIFRGLIISTELAPVYGKYKWGLVELNNCNNIIIENNTIFSVQDASSWTADDWNSLASKGIFSWSSPNVIIRNNTIKNVNYGIGVMFGDGTLIEYNKVEHNIGDGVQVLSSSNVIVQYNTLKNFYDVSGTHVDGIQFYRLDYPPCDNVILRGNMIIHHDPDVTKFTGDMHGIGCFDPPYNNWLVENNVVMVPHLHGIAIYGATDSKIINNIAFYDPNKTTYASGVEIHTGGSGSNTVIRNNMANVIDISGDNITADHNIDIDDFGPDALFADYLNNDLRHKSGSPAIDTGSADLAPDIDILGNSRPLGAGFDIGAYEYLSGPPDTTPPSTPQNLTAQAISKSQINLSWQGSSDPESGISYYKIYRDGNLVGQSTSPSYSDTNLDGGTSYSYQVSAVNGAGLESGRSNTAPATTLADTTPPLVISVSAYSATSVGILFSEVLDQASAINISNYDINNGISIISVSLNSEHNGVILSTSSHTEDVIYTLMVTGVEDTAGNAMPETSIEYRYDTGLVGLWRFDEGSGNAAEDSSGHGNTGILINGPKWTEGKINGALSFDGIDDYVEIGAGDILPPWTASFWLKREDSDNTNAVLLESSSYSLKLEQYSNTNKIGFTEYGVADYSFNYEAPIGTWIHIVFVGTSTETMLYVDGVLTDTVSNSISCPMNQISSAYSRPAKGVIDDVRIYNRELNVNEVLNLFSEAGSLVFEPIGDKQVDAGSTLTFEVITQDPAQQVFIEADPDLPFDPDIVFINKVFSWSPTSDDVGSYEVTFIAPHGQYEDFETITITVNSVEINQTPELGAIGNKSVSEGSNLSFSVNATDPDGDTVTYSVQNLPNGATFSGSTFSWTPASGQAGSYQVTFIASDGQLQDSETITITVTSAGSSLSDNLVGYWKMNDNASNTTVVDSSGKGNNGVARRNTSGLTTAGKVNGALTFNGSSDYIDCGSRASLQEKSTLSVSAWINGSNYAKTFNMIVCGDNRNLDFDWGLRLDNGVVKFWVRTVAYHYRCATGITLSAGRWYHVVGVWDRNGGQNNVRIYVDGRLEGATTADSNIGTLPVYVSIGRLYYPTVDQYFEGLIDNVMIFNRALSQQEIDTLYNSGAGTEIF